jgi:hypothetical protein
MTNGAGKGGRYRKVDPKKWDEGYDRIWGKKEDDKDDKKGNRQRPN